MAVLRDQIVALNDYPTGVYELPIQIIQNAAVNSIYFEIARCTDATPDIWPNQSTKLIYNQQVSFDNGKTWTDAGGFEAEGGIHTTWQGAQLSKSNFAVPVPIEDSGRKRWLKMTFEVINGPLRTEGFLELRD